MKIFAIICLLIIFLALQHVINWMWRLMIKEGEDELSWLFLMGATLLISLVCLHYLILWIHPLIT